MQRVSDEDRRAELSRISDEGRRLDRIREMMGGILDEERPARYRYSEEIEDEYGNLVEALHPEYTTFIDRVTERICALTSPEDWAKLQNRREAVEHVFQDAGIGGGEGRAETAEEHHANAESAERLAEMMDAEGCETLGELMVKMRGRDK